MQIVFTGVVPKELDYPEHNEDAYLTGSNIVALSDGASESFDAGHWAQILAHQYVKATRFNEPWLREAIEQYSGLYKREELSWSKQASFDRGSFATLLGVMFHEESNSVEILAIGDSLAVLINNGLIEKSYPYTSFEEFNQMPSLLSTIHVQNEFVRQQDFVKKHSVTWGLQSLPAPRLLCMTDALGQWFLKTYPSDASILDSLLSLHTEAEMQEYVSLLRKENAIRTDDTTLIVVDFSG